MPEQHLTGRARLLVALLAATAMAMSSPAEASCRFPPQATSTPAGVAKLLFDNSDALGFAVVKRSFDAEAKQPEEIAMIFSLKGPQQTLTFLNPVTDAGLIVSNYETTFGTSAGTVVFAALSRTPSGWVVSECNAQLLNVYPIEILMPELKREFLRRAD